MASNIAPIPAFTGVGRNFARRLPSAHRYGRSLLVKLTKTFLTALVLVATAFTGLRLSAVSEDAAPSALPKAVLSNMSNPQFQGVDRSGQPFFIRASSAEGISSKPRVIQLIDIRAEIALTDGSRLQLAANSGVYNDAEQKVRLDGDVTVRHGNDDRLRSQHAVVDLASGVLTIPDKVVGDGPAGTVKAEGMRLTKHGEAVTFTGKTRLTLLPKNPPLAH